MKKLLVKGILSAVLVSIGLCATTQADTIGKEGWYLEGTGGMTFATSDTRTQNASINFEQEYKTGTNGTFSIGYYMDEWRFAVQGGYFRSSIDKNNNRNTGASIPGANGNIAHWTIMGNVFYDMPIVDSVSWYFGGGLGVAVLQTDIKPVDAAGRLKSTDLAFAYQWFSGFNFDIAQMWKFVIGYHGLTHGDTKCDVNTAASTIARETKFRAPILHVVEAGFRVMF